MLELSEAVKAKIIENVQNQQFYLSGLQFISPSTESWRDVGKGSNERVMVDSFIYRVKPEPIVINGVEYERGISEVPEVGSIFYIVTPDCVRGCQKAVWKNSIGAKSFLKLGWVFLAPEPAARLGKAIRALTVKP